MSSYKGTFSANKNTFKEKIIKVLAEVRPHIQGHGGDLELVKAENGQVVIKIMGACLGCPMAAMTFNSGVEEMIKEQVPEVKKIKFI